MSSFAQECEAFIALCAQFKMPRGPARRILMCAATLQRIGVKACNAPLSNVDVQADTASEALLRAIVEAEFGWELDVNGDPRGAVVKIRIPGYHGNSFGGDGFHCVPVPEMFPEEGIQ